MNESSIILVCKKVIFFSSKDENVFFAWIKSIECIENTRATGDELYLYIVTNDLHDQDLRDLLALFYRYKIDMKQLQVFLTDNNRAWFYNNKKGYWYTNIFGEPCG